MKEHFKSVIMGDHLVGKSCLLYTFLCRSFPKDKYPYILEGTYDKIIKCDNIKISHFIEDLCGKDEYKDLWHYKYPSTDIFIICFSIISRITFENVKKKWIPELEKYSSGVPYILVGMKSDLRNDEISSDNNSNEEMSITPSEGERMKEEIKAEKYLECSSLENYNVDEVFYTAIRIVLNKRKQETSKSHCSIY